MHIQNYDILCLIPHILSNHILGKMLPYYDLSGSTTSLLVLWTFESGYRVQIFIGIFSVALHIQYYTLSSPRSRQKASENRYIATQATEITTQATESFCRLHSPSENRYITTQATEIATQATESFCRLHSPSENRYIVTQATEIATQATDSFWRHKVPKALEYGPRNTQGSL